MDNGVQTLSGGELQRCAIVLCLGTAADIYLVDEPSAYLDSEQRIAASKVSKLSFRIPSETSLPKLTPNINFKS